MLNTIIAIAIAFTMCAYFCRMLHLITKCKPWFTEFVIIVLCLLVLTYIGNTNSAYNDGFNDAVKSAELVNYHEYGYDISFGDEVHSYTNN